MQDERHNILNYVTAEQISDEDAQATVDKIDALLKKAVTNTGISPAYIILGYMDYRELSLRFNQLGEAGLIPINSLTPTQFAQCMIVVVNEPRKIDIAFPVYDTYVRGEWFEDVMST